MASSSFRHLREVQKILDQADLNYEVVHGKKHFKVTVEGSHYMTVTRSTHGCEFNIRNTIADAKRLVKRIKA